MKIEATFRLNKHIYNFFKGEIERKFLNYEDDCKFDIWKDKDNPNHYQQETAEGSKWDMYFLPNAIIEVHFEGKHYYMPNENTVGWAFKEYIVGNKSIVFNWNFNDNEAVYSFKLYGKIRKCEISLERDEKPFDFESANTMDKKTKDVARYDYYYSRIQEARLKKSAMQNQEKYATITANGKPFTLALDAGHSVEGYKKSFPDIRLIASDKEQLCEIIYKGVKQKRIYEK